jgi:hypothetical protein
MFVADKEIERVDNSHRVTHLRNILDYSDDTARSVSTDQLFYMDGGTRLADNVPFTASGVVDTNRLVVTATDGAHKLTEAQLTLRNSQSYNAGFSARELLTKTGQFTFRIPLSRIFAFCNHYKSVIHGSTVRFEFRKYDIEEIIHATGADIAGADKPIFKIEDMVLYMPYLTPSLPVLASLQETLTQGGQIELGFNYWNTYGPMHLLATDTTVRRTISSLIERPNRVIVAFKETAKYKTIVDNSLIYDHLNLTKIQLRAGSGTYYPDQPMESVFTTASVANDDYIRTFEEFLRVSDLQHNLDGGSLVNYSSFKGLYPFFSFDLRESMKDVVFNNGNAVDLTIEASLTPAGGGFEMFCDGFASVCDGFVMV